MHTADPVTSEIKTAEIMSTPILDLESAIGLSRLADGRMVIAGDEKRTEEMEPLILDESGRQLAEAQESQLVEREKEQHEFAKSGIKERAELVQADRQAIEDQYAEMRQVEPRDVTKDYTEAEHIKKQREAEAERAEQQLAEAKERGAQAEIEQERENYARNKNNPKIAPNSIHFNPGRSTRF